MQNGLEDGRLLRYDGRLCGLFSGHYQSEGRWIVIRNTMVLMDLETGDYKAFPTPERREKNWMPFVDDGRLYALYSVDPWRVVELTTPITLVHETKGFESERRWSGSSQFIPWEGGWLGVIHRRVKSVYEQGWMGSDVYDHALVYMDGAFNPVDISPPFNFTGPDTMEFCGGLDLRDGRLVFSFGVYDRHGYVLTW